MKPENPMCHATDEGIELFEQLHEKFQNRSDDNYARQLAEDTPLRLIGSGDYRAVYLDENGDLLNEKDACVVKIHKGTNVNENLNEISNWTKLPKEVTEKFIPITDWGENSKWLVMPYITGEPTKKQLFELEKHFLENGYDAQDIKKENVSIFQGDPIMNDYGGVFRKVDFESVSLKERIELKKWGLDL